MIQNKLKSIRIIDFESHEDTKVNFTEGFNLVWGKSDSGKSSIIRALSIITDNEFNNKSVRVDRAYCEIEVETDLGKINCKRGEGVNKWIVTTLDGKEHFFDKPGRTVPSMVSEILGMRKKEWGKKLSEIPNFMFQNDKHYMISEIGGEKSSSNMVARLMDRTIGLGGIEELIKEISSSITKKRKNINEYSSRISELKSGMLNEDIIEGLEKQLNTIKKIEEKICFLEEKKKILQKFMLVKQEIKENKKTLSETCDRISEIENLKNTISDNYDKHIFLTKLYNNKNEIQNNKKQLNKINEQLEILSKVENIKQEVRDFWELYKFSEKIKKLNSELNENKKQLNEFSSELSNKEKELHDYKEEIGFCPVCGNKFN
jgi:exonuclease SbcC